MECVLMNMRLAAHKMSGTRRFERELRTTTAQIWCELPRILFLALAGVFVMSHLWSITVNGGLDLVEVPVHQLEEPSTVSGPPLRTSWNIRVRAQPSVRVPQLAKGSSIDVSFYANRRFPRRSPLLDLSLLAGAEGGSFRPYSGPPGEPLESEL